jgi:GWxTD domain-containing protein
MMRAFGLFICLFLYGQLSFAIDAKIAHASFQQENEPYIELYTHITGSSLQFDETSDSLRQASVAVTVLIRQLDQIVLADKFNLLSPIAAEVPDLLDLKRYALQNGDYTATIFFRDNHAPADSTQVTTAFTIDYDQTAIELSDLELLTSVAPLSKTAHPFNKQQYQLEPLVDAYYPGYTDKLLFYAELYAPEQSGLLQLKYFLRKAQNYTDRELKIAYQKRKAKPLRPLLLALDIKDVPTGEYELVLEVRDSNHVLQATKMTRIQREFELAIPIEYIHFDDTLSAADLRYSLRAIFPIIPNDQVDTLNRVLKQEDLEKKRQFLVDFWRGKSPRYPDYSYFKYMEVAQAVDKLFKSGFRFGFETDRGYCYLRYGQPDDIINVKDEPSAPPYEIWSYYQFPPTNQNDVKFLFYNPNLAAGDYVLLHSTAIGERNNPNWEIDLYKRNAPNGPSMFGRRARELMNDF